MRSGAGSWSRSGTWIDPRACPQCEDGRDAVTCSQELSCAPYQLLDSLPLQPVLLPVVLLHSRLISPPAALVIENLSLVFAAWVVTV